MLTYSQRARSLSVLRNLDSAAFGLAATFERLSSGARINRASDDAAGLAVVSSLRVRKAIFDRGHKNLSDGASALSIMDQALASLNTIVIRQKELAEQASNGTLSDTQRSALNKEAEELSQEHQRIIDTAEFNGLNLLKGSTSSLSLKAGIGDGSTLETTFLNSSVITPGIDEITQVGDSNNYFDHGGLGSLTKLLLYETGDKPILIGVNLLDNQDTGYVDLVISTYILNDSYQFEEVAFLAFSTFDSIPAAADWGAQLSQFGTLEVMYDVDAGREEFSIEITPQGGLNELGGGTFQQDEGQSTILYDFTGNGELDELGSYPIGFSVNFAGSVISYESLSQNSFSLATQASALSALDSLTVDMERISDMQSKVGAFQSRISAASSVLQSSSEQFAAAESRINDADIAVESANALRFSLLKQSGIEVLAQVNLTPSLVLSLLD